MADEPIQLWEILRIAQKAKESGRASLAPWEREALEDFERAWKPVLERSELSHPETEEGLRMWEELPPDQRERYAHWTPRQLYAFKLLIDDLNAAEEGP